MTKHTKKPVFSIVVDGKPVSASEVRDMIGADYGKCQFMMLPDGTVRLRVHTQVKYAFFNLPEYCQVVLADPAANIKQLEAECSSLRNQYMSDGEELAALRARVAELEGALKNLIFTASVLWDDYKPIKDSGSYVVTHPVIEAARAAIEKVEGDK
jgi:hypothetical protein